MKKSEINNALRKHFGTPESTPNDQEINESQTALFALFELLIEIDKDLMKSHEPPNHRDTNNPD